MEFRTLRNFAIRSNPKYTVPLDKKKKKIHYVKEGFYTTIGWQHYTFWFRGMQEGFYWPWPIRLNKSYECGYFWKKRVCLNHKDNKVPPNISLSTTKFKGKFNGLFDSCISK